MKKWVSSMLFITTAIVMVSFVASLVHSDKVAETVPPSPNFITVS